MDRQGDPSAAEGTAVIADELREATRLLSDKGIDGAARDARLLLAHVLEVEAARLIVMAQDRITQAQSNRFRDLVQGRLARKPVSHLTGQRLFYGRQFAVGLDVLDPRPETETLIDAALSVPFRDVLDLGTGSGAILLTLLAERAGSAGVGTDLSPRALSVAARNAEALGLSDRCKFVQSDWFEAVSGRFDLIVSNPPYIALDDMAGLAPELAHEPRMALTDEGDGLTAYHAITSGAAAHLTPGGFLMVEIGPTQGPAVSRLFEQAGFTKVEILPDLDGRDRVVMGQSC